MSDFTGGRGAHHTSPCGRLTLQDSCKTRQLSVLKLGLLKNFVIFNVSKGLSFKRCILLKLLLLIYCQLETYLPVRGSLQFFN